MAYALDAAIAAILLTWAYRGQHLGIGGSVIRLLLFFSAIAAGYAIFNLSLVEQPNVPAATAPVPSVHDTGSLDILYVLKTLEKVGTYTAKAQSLAKAYFLPSVAGHHNFCCRVPFAVAFAVEKRAHEDQGGRILGKGSLALVQGFFRPAYSLRLSRHSRRCCLGLGLCRFIWKASSCRITHQQGPGRLMSCGRRRKDANTSSIGRARTCSGARICAVCQRVSRQLQQPFPPRQGPLGKSGKPPVKWPTKPKRPARMSAPLA